MRPNVRGLSTTQFACLQPGHFAAFSAGASLGMPAMTMVFRAADPKFLDKVKEGDKVSFVADKVNGQFTVTKIEPAK